MFSSPPCCYYGRLGTKEYRNWFISIYTIFIAIFLHIRVLLQMLYTDTPRNTQEFLIIRLTICPGSAGTVLLYIHCSGITRLINNCRNVPYFNLKTSCTHTRKFGPRETHLFWSRLLPAQYFIIHCRQRDPERAKHVGRFVLRCSRCLNFIWRKVGMTDWKLNFKWFGKKRWSWPNINSISVFEWKGRRKFTKILAGLQVSQQGFKQTSSRIQI
jgi:hypothetical protein